MAKKTKTITAFCFADGVIKFGNKVPDGALIIANGPEQVVRKTISVTARESYPSKPGGKDTVPLVPGIPESRGDQNKCLDALHVYIHQVEMRLAFTPEWLSKQDSNTKLSIIRTGMETISRPDRLMELITICSAK